MLALVNSAAKDASVELRDVAEPQAVANEAVIAVKAFSLNRGELSLLASRPEGWRPGQDIAGIVMKPATDGSGPREGTRVVGRLDEAGWAQRVAVPTARLAVLPDSISFASAATLPVAGLTAYRILRLGGSLLGQRVLVTGAAGGVGRFAVQLGALAGAEVTGVVGRPERAAGLRELGANSVVTTMQEAQGHGLFDLILESVGGSSLTTAISLIAPNGTIVIFGNSSGEDTPLNMYAFSGHQGARLQSFFVSSSGTPDSMGADLARLVSLVERGKLTPQIGMDNSWHDLTQGAAVLRNRQVSGKAVFRVE